MHVFNQVASVLIQSLLLTSKTRILQALSWLYCLQKQNISMWSMWASSLILLCTSPAGPADTSCTLYQETWLNWLGKGRDRWTSGTNISLHAACVIHRNLEVSRKYELYHRIEVIRTGQYASERGYSLLVIVFERCTLKIFIFITPVTLWVTKQCSRAVWWGVNMIWLAWIWNILFRVIDAKKAFAVGKVTQAT